MSLKADLVTVVNNGNPKPTVKVRMKETMMHFIIKMCFSGARYYGRHYFLFIG